MEPFLQAALALAVGAIGGAVASWLTFRNKVERYIASNEASDQERNEARRERNIIVDSRLNSHSSDLKHISVLAQRITRLESDYETLHRWKNEALYAELDRRGANVAERIDRVEKSSERADSILEARIARLEK